mgnify:CR=1 FL=1
MKDAIQILREELKEKNSEIGITTLEDMAKLQIEPLTREVEKKYSIVKADYENLKSTVIMFRDMVKNYDKPAIPKDDLLADIAMFFDSFLTEATE